MLPMMLNKTFYRYCAYLVAVLIMNRMAKSVRHQVAVITSNLLFDRYFTDVPSIQ